MPTLFAALGQRHSRSAQERWPEVRHQEDLHRRDRPLRAGGGHERNKGPPAPPPGLRLGRPDLPAGIMQHVGFISSVIKMPLPPLPFTSWPTPPSSTSLASHSVANGPSPRVCAIHLPCVASHESCCCSSPQPPPTLSPTCFPEDGNWQPSKGPLHCGAPKHHELLWLLRGRQRPQCGHGVRGQRQSLSAHPACKAALLRGEGNRLALRLFDVSTCGKSGEQRAGDHLGLNIAGRGFQGQQDRGSPNSAASFGAQARETPPATV